MSNYIITKNPDYFKKIGDYNYCNLEDMDLPETIAFDSETTGLEARHHDMFCIQIGTGKNNYIIQLYDNNYTFEEVIPYLKDKILIGHNILFDLGFCYKHNFFPKKVKDTMLASKILYNGDYEIQRHDFGSVMERELGIKYDKTEQKNIDKVKLSQESTIKYSFNDVDRLLELHEYLEQKIIKRGFKKTYNLHCRYIRALAYIEQCGMPISSEKWKAKMIVDLENATKWKKTIEEYIFDNLECFRNNQIDMFDDTKKIIVSINSPLQMIKVFEKFGIPTKDKDGKDSINESIISKSKHEFVEMWLKYQNANHRVTTFGESVYKQIENNRIYTNFNPMVDTARLSSRKGTINFLNFPADKETRDCFVANEGYSMVVCDWSGQETVIAADLSGDNAMTHSVNTGACLHCAFARVLYPEIADLDDETIQKEHKAKRQAAKSPRFAFQYGGSAFTIHQNEGIPLERCYEIENAFKELHSGLYVWGAKEFEKAISQGYIESADGWKLKLPKFDIFKSYEEKIKAMSKENWTVYKEGKLEYKALQENDKYEIKNKESFEYYKSKKKEVSQYFKLKSEYQRLCLNNPVQSRGAHQLKLATIYLFEWIEENNLYWKVKICNSVHDELVIEALEELKEKATLAVQKSMVDGGNHYLKNLKIKADAHYGDSWYSAK